LIVNAELPPAVTDVGLSAAVGPAGLTVALRLTVPALPLVTAVVIVLFPFDPWAIVTVVGEALIEKSLAGTEVGLGVGVGLGLGVAVAVGVGLGLGVAVAVAVGVGVGVGLGVTVALGVGVGVGLGAPPPQLANLNEPMRVLQLNAPLLGIYSVVNQKVQSSVGSTLIEL